MRWRSLFLCILCCVFGCSGTQITGAQLAPEQAQALRIGALETGYGAELPADRLGRARGYGLAQRLANQVEVWLTEIGRFGGPDSARIEVTRFRLPAPGGRWVTGMAKGNDYLGTEVTVMRDGESLAPFQVERTLGTGDRSVAENYSANRALENLVEAVAWSIAFELTPREVHWTLLELGKREQIERALEILYRCGELSYGEELKYSTLGKLSATGGFAKLGGRPKWCRELY